MKNERLAIQFDLIGALVQLVRMPACHAGGHEFESRTHRRKQSQFEVAFFCFTALFFPFSISWFYGSLVGVQQ